MVNEWELLRIAVPRDRIQRGVERAPLPPPKEEKLKPLPNRKSSALLVVTTIIQSTAAAIDFAT